MHGWSFVKRIGWRSLNSSSNPRGVLPEHSKVGLCFTSLDFVLTHASVRLQAEGEVKQTFGYEYTLQEWISQCTWRGKSALLFFMLWSTDNLWPLHPDVVLWWGETSTQGWVNTSMLHFSPGLQKWKASVLSIHPWGPFLFASWMLFLLCWRGTIHVRQEVGGNKIVESCHEKILQVGCKVAQVLYNSCKQGFMYWGLASSPARNLFGCNIC